jgi:SAM-dependent methyltransferase
VTGPAASPRGRTSAFPLRLGHDEAAIFDLFVVPRYLSMFGERVVALLAPGTDARVCHLHCRTGYPDEQILEPLPNAHVHGLDPSASAIALARAKAAALRRQDASVVLDYRVAETLPVPFPRGSFSHAFTIHPPAIDRAAIYEELARVVAPRGQALVAMPLRGSFVEIVDLLRECALKHDLPELAGAVDAAIQLRPTDDMFQRELEAAGFEFVDVDLRTRTLKFESGRRFFEDPLTRLLLLPELRGDLGMRGVAPAGAAVDPFLYVEQAIDKYWSGRAFELTIVVGVVSGRRRA